MLQLGCPVAIGSEPVEVTLTPIDDDIWHITFETSRSTAELRLVRTPDDSRLRRWEFPDDEFLLVHNNGDDRIRRRDGGSFSRVAVVVPATYIPLPKEYAPFSPFEDGGLLVFTGRYHACYGDCPDDSPSAGGPWKMNLALPPGSRAIVNGVIHERTTTWMDVGDGTKIYVGPAEPLETHDFISIVDETLPEHIGERLSTLLPALMDFYARRLVPPARKPMLFASYDPGYGSGYGQQGGTLPDQVFMHFYGPGWADNQTGNQLESATTSAGMTAFFFAHEAAHLFQARDRTRPRDKIAWVHEGGAEAFALLALTKLQSVSHDYAEYRKSDAFDKCVSGLNLHPLNEAAAAGNYQDYYACGLLMNLAVDSSVRQSSNGQRDLFDFWRSFLATVEVQSDWTQEKFLSALRNEGAERTSMFLRSLADDQQSNPQEFLRKGLHEAGLSGSW